MASKAVRAAKRSASARGDTNLDRRESRSERGFALVLALLTLMLLTFLGLTLATTTSTELQIATNYRWSQQAFFNAEAGLEAGKSLMRNMDWSAILPPPRAGAGWDPAAFSSPGVAPVAPYARSDGAGLPSRNFENAFCDAAGNGAGYGVVLDDGSAVAPFQNVSSVFGQGLNGAFTLWVRRNVVFNPVAGTYSDDPEDGVVLTVEGTAPYLGASLGTNLAQANRAIRVLELTLTQELPSNCGSRSGQEGGGAEGSGFGGCDPITGDGVEAAVASAGVGTTPVDTGTQ